MKGEMRENPVHMLDALNQSYSHRNGFWALMALVIAAFLGMTFGVPLLIRGLYAADMNINLAWLWPVIDPRALQGDLRNAYQTTFWGWPGVAFAYWLPLKFLSLEQTGKLLAAGLGLCVIVLAYQIGRALGGGRGGGAVALLCVFAMFRPHELNLWSNLQGGLPRAFAAPFIWLAMLGSLKQRCWVLGASIAGALCCYPPAALLIAGMIALDWAASWLADRAAAKTAFIPLLAVAGTSALVGLWLARQHLDGAIWGPPPTFAEAAAMPIFRPGGTLGAVAGPTRFTSWLNTHGGLTFTLLAALVLLAPLAVIGARSNPDARRACRLSLSLFATSLIGYAAAYAFFFRLYLPDRYVLYGAAPAVWLLLLLAALATVRRIEASPARARLIGVSSVALAAGICLLCAANFIRMFPRDESAGHTGLYRSPIPRAIIQRLRELPREAVVAAQLERSGDIPFLTGTRIFLSTDDLMPFHMTYFQTMLERCVQLQAALFATDWSTVERFARNNRVDYALIDVSVYGERPGEFGWDDWYPMLRVPALSAGQAFVLAHPEPNRILNAEKNFLLVDLRPR